MLKVLQKLNDYKIEHLLRPITPLLMIGSVIHCNLSNMSVLGGNLSEFIIPSFFLFFGAPLCANVVYKQMQLSNTLVVSYLVGVSIFFFIKRYQQATRFMVVFPIVGRISMLCGMKNSKEDVLNILMWLIISDFVGVLIGKTFEHGTISFKDKDFHDLISNILIVLIGREIALPDIFVVFGVLFSLAVKNRKMFCCREMKEFIETTEISLESSKKWQSREMSAKTSQETEQEATPVKKRGRKKKVL